MGLVSLNLRVLVVDDNCDAADTLADLLRLCGADVRVCYNAESALEAISEFDFEAGVLDVHMPRIDGCELARRLRARSEPKRVLLIALTGVSDEAARQRTAEAGFDLHLTKASAPEILVAALAAFSRWLAEHQTREAKDATEHRSGS
jgi:DNA-binding response OmpR family regulator